MSIEAAILSGALLLILMGKMEVAKCELHPWIHAIPSGNSAQNLVAWSQDEKCGLKYDIFIFQTKRQSHGWPCL
jgi:hypothetical protein